MVGSLKVNVKENGGGLAKFFGRYGSPSQSWIFTPLKNAAFPSEIAPSPIKRLVSDREIIFPFWEWLRLPGMNAREIMVAQPPSAV
jgi:hypothetical protein